MDKSLPPPLYKSIQDIYKIDLSISIHSGDMAKNVFDLSVTLTFDLES